MLQKEAADLDRVQTSMQEEHTLEREEHVAKERAAAKEVAAISRAARKVEHELDPHHPLTAAQILSDIEVSERCSTEQDTGKRNPEGGPASYELKDRRKRTPPGNTDSAGDVRSTVSGSPGLPSDVRSAVAASPQRLADTESSSVPGVSDQLGKAIPVHRAQQTRKSEKYGEGDANANLFTDTESLSISTASIGGAEKTLAGVDLDARPTDSHSATVSDSGALLAQTAARRVLDGLASSPSVADRSKISTAKVEVDSNSSGQSTCSDSRSVTVCECPQSPAASRIYRHTTILRAVDGHPIECAKPPSLHG